MNTAKGMLSSVVFLCVMTLAGVLVLGQGEGGERQDQLRRFLAQARAARHQTHYGLAIDIYMEALAHCRHDDHLGRAQSLWGLARPCWDMGRPEKALTYYERAIDSMEDVRASLTEAALRQRHLEGGRLGASVSAFWRQLSRRHPVGGLVASATALLESLGGHWQEQLTWAQALRQAQIELIATRATPGDLSHPWFWAPFQLIGRWR